MPAISARRLKRNFGAPPARINYKIDNQIDLASVEMLFTTFLRPANCGPVITVIAAGMRPSASAFRESEMLRICDERNNGAAAHSRFAGQEIDSICNRNFV
jgi:hypothetical protein